MEIITPQKPNNSVVDYQAVPKNDETEAMHNLDLEAQNDDDCTRRGQWLRAAVLGANDGLLSTAALMMGVGAVRQDAKTMILTGVAGLVAGACSMAIGEFVSVYAQYDVEMAQLERTRKKRVESEDDIRLDEEKLPNPVEAAAASALSFAVGAAVPLAAVPLAAAANVRSYGRRVAVVVAAVSLALMVFGAVGAAIGKAPRVKSAVRVLVGGWVAMGITFGLTKLIGKSGLN